LSCTTFSPAKLTSSSAVSVIVWFAHDIGDSLFINDFTHWW